MKAEDTKNLAYWERNMLALLIARLNPDKCGWYRHEGEDAFEGWGRIISLFDGSVTFHIPDDFDIGDLKEIEPNWNGHTTKEKWDLIKRSCGIQN